MSLTIEQTLVNSFIAMMKKNAKNEKIPCSFSQLETGATAIGVPDLIMFFDHKTYWIECKRLYSDHVARSNIAKFKGVIKFRPGQARFLHNLQNNGEKAFILVLTDYLDCILVPVRDVPLDASTFRVDHLGASFVDAYKFIKEALEEQPIVSDKEPL